MDEFKRHRTDQDLQRAANRVLARVQELAQVDRAESPFPLVRKRAGDQPDGTIVRWGDGDVAFLLRRGHQILVCTPATGETGYSIGPDEGIEVVLTPAEVATYFISSQDMQLACWRAMLLFQASREVTRSVFEQEALDEAMTDPRRQAILRAATDS